MVRVRRVAVATGAALQHRDLNGLSSVMRAAALAAAAISVDRQTFFACSTNRTGSLGAGGQGEAGFGDRQRPAAADVVDRRADAKAAEAPMSRAGPHTTAALLQIVRRYPAPAWQSRLGQLVRVRTNRLAAPSRSAPLGRVTDGRARRSVR